MQQLTAANDVLMYVYLYVFLDKCKFEATYEALQLQLSHVPMFANLKPYSATAAITVCMFR